jgi:hypothetical protein
MIRANHWTEIIKAIYLKKKTTVVFTTLLSTNKLYLNSFKPEVVWRYCLSVFEANEHLEMIKCDRHAELTFNYRLRERRVGPTKWMQLEEDEPRFGPWSSYSNNSPATGVTFLENHSVWNNQCLMGNSELVEPRQLTFIKFQRNCLFLH